MLYKKILIERFDTNAADLSGEFNVFRDHDSTKFLGKARIYKDEGVLYADLNLLDDCKGLYPSIGFTILETYKSKQQKIDIKTLGLCATPNTDRLIQPLN